MKVFIYFTFFLIFHLVGYSQQYTIYCGKLIHPQSNEVSNETTIYINNGKIFGVVKGYKEIKGELINLRDKTVMPGLMDMHIHLHNEMNPLSYSDRIKLNTEDYAINGVINAEKTLLAGFTTVRDLRSPKHVSLALRNAINKEIIPGPRIIAAAGVASTGGHFDPTNGLNKDLMWHPDETHGIADSPEQIHKAIRQAYKDGYDMIKIAATGGVLSLAKSGQNPQFTSEEMNEIIKIAEDYGFTTAAHAHGTEGMKRAVLAGVTSIEHGTFMDKEVIELMIENGTYYVPTIIAGKFVEEMSKIDGYFPSIVRPKAAAIGPQIHKTFAIAYKSGVKIAFGTDSGVSPHGDNWKEFIYMTEGGMSLMEAIKSATVEASKLIKMENQLGTIEKGKIADIIAVDGNPFDDINAMGNVSFVMKNGLIYKN